MVWSSRARLSGFRARFGDQNPSLPHLGFSGRSVPCPPARCLVASERAGEQQSHLKVKVCLCVYENVKGKTTIVLL